MIKNFVLRNLYTLSIIGSVVSYDIARAITSYKSNSSFLEWLKIPNINVAEAFWYCDIVILLIAIVASPILNRAYNIDIYNFNFYKKNKRMIAYLMLPVLASMFKALLASNVSGAVITSYSLLTPFFVILISLFVFKNKEILTKWHYLSFIICVSGFILTKYSKLAFGLDLALLLYVFINALSNIAVRYIAINRNNLDGVVFEFLIYAGTGIILFGFTAKASIIFMCCYSLLILPLLFKRLAFIYKPLQYISKDLKRKILPFFIFTSCFILLYLSNFSFKILFSGGILLLSIPSIIHHIFTILGHQHVATTLEIQLKDFMKVLFAFISSYLFFANIPLKFEIIGVVIILIGLSFLPKDKK